MRENPLRRGMCLVSGVVGEHPERRIEAAAVCPYPLAGDIALDDVWLGEALTAVSDLTQAYDFASGELTSGFRFRAGGAEARIEIVTFASRTAPAIVLQETGLEVDARPAA